MEQWFRRILEKIGGLVDAKADAVGLRDLTLRLATMAQRAIEQNVREEAGRHVAPHAVMLSLPYELSCRLTDDLRKSLADAVAEILENFVRDRRYALARPLTVTTISDVFRDSPAVKVGFDETSANPAAGVSNAAPTLVSIVARSGQELFSGPIPIGASVSLGRSAGNRVVIDDASVSKFHATITRSPSGALTVSDLGSTNGTFLDGMPVSGCVELHPGKRLRFGDVECTFSEK